ncbi:MAG: redoxin domain-containing protein [Dehalococcoidia bacterium]|nr:redoxin domain-containing protein [Dehalococcoidia bacterium]
MAIEIGQEAPDFTLPDENNEEVTLSALRGTPVVLVFYFSDFSGICTDELCVIRDDHSAWIEKGATVLGISRDTRFVHAAFKQHEGIPFTLLADMKGEVARAYDTWNDALGAAERLTAVIDRDGKIAYLLKNPIPDARDHSLVEAAIN